MHIVCHVASHSFKHGVQRAARYIVLCRHSHFSPNFYILRSAEPLHSAAWSMYDTHSAVRHSQHAFFIYIVLSYHIVSHRLNTEFKLQSVMFLTSLRKSVVGGHGFALHPRMRTRHTTMYKLFTCCCWQGIVIDSKVLQWIPGLQCTFYAALVCSL